MTSTYASKDLCLRLIVVNLKRVVIEVTQSDNQKKTVGNVALVRDWEPQLQVFQLLRTGWVDVDTASEADFSQLVVGVAVDVFCVEKQVLLAQSPEVHVEFSSDELLGHELDESRVNRDFDLEETQDVVDGIEAGNRLDTHEIGHVHKWLGLKHSELSIFREQLSVFE